jgi:hypothetical protein
LRRRTTIGDWECAAIGATFREDMDTARGGRVQRWNSGPPGPVRGLRRQPCQTWLFTALLAVVVGVAWPTVSRLSPPAAPWRVPLLLLAAGFAAGQLVAVRFEFAGEAHVTTLSEVPLVIGLVFANPDRLLVATLVGTAVGVLWRRQAPIKAAFNITTRALETLVATVCFHVVLGGTDAASPWGWLAAFVAVPAANLVSAVCVQVVIALSVGRFNRAGLRTLTLVLVCVAAVNVAVGCLAVAVLWGEDRGAVVFLFGIAVVLRFGYRSHSMLRDRHGDLEQIYRFSRALSGLVKAEDVIQAVLSQAKALLRSRVAELALRGPDGDIRYTLSGGGPVVRRVIPGAHPLSEVAQMTGGVLAPRGTGDRRLVDALATCGLADAPW